MFRNFVKIGKKILIVISILVVILFGAFYIYTLDYYKADEAASNIVAEQSERIEKKENLVIFHPESENNKNVGIIFYPGGKVESSAYAPLLSSLSDNGYTCILVKMPFHLAVFDVNAADSVPKILPEINSWYLAGHSLGGAMASSYGMEHSEWVKGLILLAAYPTKATKIPTLVLYGSEDMVLNKEKIASIDNKIEIAGGNHAYFGNYGEQKGDGTATISREEQQMKAVEEIVMFITDLK